MVTVKAFMSHALEYRMCVRQILQDQKYGDQIVLVMQVTLGGATVRQAQVLNGLTVLKGVRCPLAITNIMGTLQPVETVNSMT